MVEATRELGTDNSLVIYQTLNSVKTTVEAMNERLNVVAEIPALRQSIEALENTVNDLLTNRQEDTVNLSQIADLLIAHSESLDAIIKAEREVIDGNKSTLKGLNNIQVTLDTFVGWFTPILDDFRETAILPTLQKTLGRVEQLYVSHEEIKTLAVKVQEQVSPLIERLSKSPVLRMLGVNDND